MAYFPISTNGVFDRYGAEYNVSAVLTPALSLDRQAYSEYSPLYFPSTYVTVYCLAFALATSLIVHTGLYYTSTICATLKDISKAQTDIHAKLMLAYKEVPNWWYYITFVICLSVSVVAVEVSAFIFACPVIDC